MEKNLVSVVIPFYRGKKWLCEAIESVFSQNYEAIEVILINDGSPEDISDILSRYKSIIYIYQENKGAASARNIGIKASTGEFIAFLDADDLWLPKKIEKQIFSMINYNSFWSHTSYTKFTEDNKEQFVDVSKYRDNIFPLSIISNPIATPSIIIKKEAFILNPELGFEESMKYGEDTILWIKLSKLYPLLVVNEPLVKVRIRGDNSALSAYSQIKARAEIWRSINSESFFEVENYISKYAEFSYKWCVKSYFLIKNLEMKLSPNIIEVFSKVIYFIPWIIFQMEKKVLLKEKGEM